VVLELRADAEVEGKPVTSGYVTDVERVLRYLEVFGDV